MQQVVSVEEMPEEIRELKQDEQLRVVVSKNYDYAEIWYRDTFTQKQFSFPGTVKGGVYQAIWAVTPMYARSWEELAVAVAREIGRLGTVAVAYTAWNRVARIEV